MRNLLARQSNTGPEPRPAEEKLRIAEEAVLDIKAVNPVVLDMREVTVITDYFLICHGSSNVHIRAVADRVLERFEERRLRPFGTEGYRQSEWILLDFGDVVVHIFSEEARRLLRVWSGSGTMRLAGNCRRRTMPMSEDAPPPNARQQLRDLMGRATLARVRGEKEQALKLAHEALALDEQNWEVHEFIGDVLMEINRGAEALASFKRARELNPKRVELEDKVARAAIRWVTRQDRMAHMNALLEGRVPRGQERKPVVAGLLSLLLPGLGQFYNWQMAKGAAFAVGYLVLVMLVVYSWAAGMKATRDLGAGLSAAGIWIALGGVLMIIAVIDAALTARKTHDSDKTGLV